MNPFQWGLPARVATPLVLRLLQHPVLSPWTISSSIKVSMSEGKNLHRDQREQPSDDDDASTGPVFGFAPLNFYLLSFSSEILPSPKVESFTGTNVDQQPIIEDGLLSANVRFSLSELFPAVDGHFTKSSLNGSHC